ncbi:FAD-dependent oxidoreductase [Streptomyces sp. A3M-1-3]|uniref:flavin monoamine oxidase family protein n=1 Tax=Streptomyces sp. A3M-1-3 TaxID=2962044 RepID=UPI0020B891F6|nr:NAD(P)/FAD-dependent oxidoreductase [Streptomyces sp. A3M-1-3]MCP3822755.1 FAD-dependent oxidoreductase [Streptomyces sp. A3M-1-3]
MTSHAADSTRGSDGLLGRRSLLKAFGATALAGSLGTLTAGTARAAGGVEDAIVIGAGYAGATVARELALKGLRPLVLEARDRVGGRIWTDTFAGEQVEIGGGWLGPQQTLVHRELERYGMATYVDVKPDQVVLPAETGYQTMTPEEAGATLDPLWGRFYEGSQNYFERPQEPLFRKDLLVDVDPLSLQDRLDQLGLSPLERKWLSGETSVYSGGLSSTGSLTGMAQWIQLSGGSYGTYSTTMSLRPVGGMTVLLQAMLDESQATVQLNSPVAGITESDGLVTVRLASGRSHTSRVVVVATPTNVWKSITFAPGLPPAHTQAATQGIGVPHATKMWIQIRGQVPAAVAQAPEGSPILMIVPQAQTAEGRLAVAFTGPSLDVSSAWKVQEAVQQLLPGSTLVRYRAMEWHKEKYTAGGWGLRRPNQLLQLFPGIEEPHGRLVFAGADIAQGWHGAFIEGAIESGLRAATQAAALAA